MARDPGWLVDQKKRLREDARRFKQGGLIGEGGLLRGAASDIGDKLGQINQAYDPKGVLYGEEAARAPLPERTAPPRPDFQNVQGSSYARPQDLGATAKTGLQRIVKNPDGSYTNMAQYEQPGAEERFYNLYGNQQTDFSEKGLADARASIGYAQRGANERIELETERALEALPPEQRVALMRTQLTESGQDRRAGLTRAQQAAQFEATNALGERNADRADTVAAANEQARLREFVAKNPGAVNQLMAELTNLPPAEQAAILSDPNNKTGATLRFALQQQLNNQYADTQLGQITRNTFLPGLFGEYDLNNGVLWDTKVDAQELGVDPEILESGILTDQYRRLRR